ncbi:MAG: alkaline phosphatase family protein [Phycisphaerales bacterium]|nr:alkaline phosphatase family protein [Phycisphaerales bacterium]
MSRGIAKRVLLLGWDAADWKMIDPLMEAGQMPNLKRLIERGVMGNVASLSPMLSPILWTSIATGKHADKHGILGFAEPDVDNNKIRPVTSTSRKCKAIWNILSERGMNAGAINWFASHPAEPINGFMVSDRYPHAVSPPDKEWPTVAGSVHPAELLDEACKLRVHPATTMPQHVLPFIPDLKDLDPLKEKKLHELRVLLAQCASVQAVSTFMMQKREWDFLGIYFDTIDRFAHAFMEFHPPKMPHVSDRDFEVYQHVMNGAYKFHDMMLGRMMQLAGEDTTIIILSDHGFHCDHLRPQGSAEIKDGRPVAWHRLHGMLVISGPGIKKDERVYGASLLDIAPTILWLMGLPVADDMDGNALIQIAEGELTEPERIETYESDSNEEAGSAVSASSIADPEGMADDPWAAQQMMQQLVGLGYIEQDASVDGVVLDRARNLGQVYAATGRPEQAIEQYQKVLSEKPDDKGCKMAIATCRLQLGELDECERIVREVLGEKDDAPQANLYLGMIHFRRGETEAALERLLEAERADPNAPGLHCQIGNVHLTRKRYADAQRSFEKALAIDPNNAEAHDGLGVALRWQKRPAEAVNSHMQSVALLHHRPQTHIHLGLALAEVGRIDWAIRAFNVALQQNPDSVMAHRCLAQLYQRVKGDTAKAEAHREHARRIRAH